MRSLARGVMNGLLNRKGREEMGKARRATIFHSSHTFSSSSSDDHDAQQNPKANSPSSPSSPLSSSLSLSSSSSSCVVEPLWAVHRDAGQVPPLRKEGFIPGIISDLDPQTGRSYSELIFLQKAQIWGLMTRLGKQGFMSRIHDLHMHAGLDSDVVESRERVSPRRIYLANGSRHILNLALVRVRRNAKLKMVIPIKFKGRANSPGLLAGGTLLVLKKSVSCLCFPDEIPEYIEVDVSELKIGDRILLKDVGVELQRRRQEYHVVCEVFRKGVNKYVRRKAFPSKKELIADLFRTEKKPFGELARLSKGG